MDRSRSRNQGGCEVTDGVGGCGVVGEGGVGCGVVTWIGVGVAIKVGVK